MDDVVIAFIIGIVLLVIILILYLMGDIPHLSTLGKILTIVGGTSTMIGVALEASKTSPPLKY